ncbi:MAG: MFS transporter [Firmicutes bacterium]|nr:MFS transporter [Alicyclobacillaceae bacterium]MCL6497274.1 MFS transporter [Bacillota bacterium]
MGRGLSGFSPDLWWLTVSLGLFGLGFGLYAVIWPLWVERLGGGPLAIGLIGTVASVVTAASVWPGGWLADRWDRRCLIFWGSALAVPVPLAFAAAHRWTALIPGMVVYCASNFSLPALQAVIVSETAPERLATVYNLIMAAFAVGMTAGPALGGALAEWAGFGPVFDLAAALYLLSALAVLPIRPKPARPRTGLGPVAPILSPALRRWLALASLAALAGGISGPFVVPYLKMAAHLDLEAIGGMGSLGVLAATVSGPAWGWAAARWGIPRVMGLGFGLGAFGAVLLLLDPGRAAGLFAATFLRGIGEGARTLGGVAIGRAVDPTQAGRAYGTLNLITEGVGALAPLAGGWLYARAAWLPLWCGAALTGLLAAGLLAGPPYRWPWSASGPETG